jgi:hypothetical protein
MATSPTQPQLSDQVVLFLGAGASRYEGYPLMSTFLDDLKAAYPSGKDESAKRKREAFDTLLAFRLHLSKVRDVVNTDFDNIEELYSAAHMFAMAYPEEELKVPQGLRKAGEVPEQIAIAIWEMCRLRPFEGQFHNTPAHHTNMFSLLNRSPTQNRSMPLLSRCAIVTTNYDILPELGAWCAKAPFWYGLNVGLRPRAGTEMRNHGVRILKLHGSVNWFVGEAEPIYDFAMGTFDTFKSLHQWPAIQSSNYEIPDGHRPLIVPPSFSKDATHPILRAVWTEAVSAISRARILVFVGYSFPRTDTFVQQLLHVALLQNPDLRRVIVIDPEEAVGEYARKRVFNDVFSGKRLHFIKDCFSDSAWKAISAEIDTLEQQAVM